MEDKNTYIKAEMGDETLTVDIHGNPMKLGYLIAKLISQISKKSKLPLPVLMGYIETATRKLDVKDTTSKDDDDKDCENCPVREKCEEMNAAVQHFRGLF